MKKLICVSLLALSVATANAATYRPGFYVKGEVGVAIFSDKDMREGESTMIPFGIGAGYKFNEMFRTELGLRYKQKSHTDSDGDKLKIDQYTLLMNAFYDFHNSSMLTPYVTAGVGFAKPKITNTPKVGAATSGSQTAFAYNLGLGSKAQISKDFDLDLSYRFIGMSLDKEKFEKSSALNAHEITLGLIFNL